MVSEFGRCFGRETLDAGIDGRTQMAFRGVRRRIVTLREVPCTLSRAGGLCQWRPEPHARLFRGQSPTRLNPSRLSGDNRMIGSVQELVLAECSTDFRIERSIKQPTALSTQEFITQSVDCDQVLGFCR